MIVLKDSSPKRQVVMVRVIAKMARDRECDCNYDSDCDGYTECDDDSECDGDCGSDYDSDCDGDGDDDKHRGCDNDCDVTIVLIMEVLYGVPHQSTPPRVARGAGNRC